MKTPLLILAYVLPLTLLPSELAAQLVYANTQTSAFNGSCTTCSITNAPNAVTTDTTDFSVINLTVQTAGGQVWQQLRFPSAAAAGTYVYVIVEHPSQLPLNTTNLNGIRLTSYLNNVSNMDTKQSSNYSITPYGPTKYLIGFMPLAAFDGIEVRMIVQNPTNPLSNLRVYAAFTSVAPLPVELLYFTANPGYNSIMLEWATATETNNDYFTIEKSTDGKNFSIAGLVDGAGTSAYTNTYSFEDAEAQEGIWYYRLKQTDHNGKCTYSKIVAAQPRNRRNIDIYPNPCSQMFYIDILDEDADVEVLNMAGEKVYEQKVKANDSNSIRLPGTLKNGIYMVMITSGSRTNMQKLVVK